MQVLPEAPSQSILFQCEIDLSCSLYGRGLQGASLRVPSLGPFLPCIGRTRNRPPLRHFSKESQ